MTGIDTLIFSQNVSLIEFMVGILNFSLFTDIQLQVFLDGKCLQEFLVKAGSQESILGSTFFLMYVYDLADDVLGNIASMLMKLRFVQTMILHPISGSSSSQFLN